MLFTRECAEEARLRQAVRRATHQISNALAETLAYADFYGHDRRLPEDVREGLLAIANGAEQAQRIVQDLQAEVAEAGVPSGVGGS